MGIINYTTIFEQVVTTAVICCASVIANIYAIYKNTQILHKVEDYLKFESFVKEN